MDESLKRQVSRLIDRIVAEENSFLQRLSAMRIDQNSLEDVHEQLVGTYGNRPDHSRLRELHEAMFKVHRKIRSEHDRALHRILSLGSKVAQDLIPEAEVREEVVGLERLLKRISADHALLETERKRILAEHEASMRNLSGHAQ